MSETLTQELSRLLDAWRHGEVQNRQEAWNLIADFAIENGDTLVAALHVLETVEVTGSISQKRPNSN